MSALLLATTMFTYMLVALSELRAGHNGLSLAFLGYAFSNVGLIWATYER